MNELLVIASVAGIAGFICGFIAKLSAWWILAFTATITTVVFIGLQKHPGATGMNLIFLVTGFCFVLTLWIGYFFQ